MFTEQCRLAARLEEVFNHFFYDEKIIITEYTSALATMQGVRGYNSWR